MLDHGADVDAENFDGETALQFQSKFGMVAGPMIIGPDSARLLIEKGADIEARDEGGSKALDLAAGKNSLDAAHLLIEHGANTDGIDLSWMNDQKKP